ncbi:PxKF domain-containing protein [Sinomonas terrae]|uniref:PxKF domain-containing protein n=1 Tax=Sinomonas terrae TaxID=2908838 RepID=A0ABS9TY60_9MICC|nr:PxKF domain-containing protein [Sinomonas terrae]MCH6469366.1 PxKF domain-containing protein [Sinomonas terrae]
MIKKRSIAVASATAFLVAAGAGAAVADTVGFDGDYATTGTQHAVTLGTIPCNVGTTATIGLWANRNGLGTGTQTFANGASLSPYVSEPVTGVTLGTAQMITLPGNWQNLGNNAVSSVMSVPLTVTPTSTGTVSETLGLGLTGKGSGGGTISRATTMTISWNTDCSPKPPPAPVNTAPTAPGVPVPSTVVNQGAFSLNWDASTDAEGDAFTYTLQGKNASGTGWQTIESGLTSPSYSFTTGNPGEGTWVYQVQAVETSTSPALSSDYSQSSATVTVDRTGPNAPIASTDTASAYFDGTTNWWKDNVTVSFAGNGDPALADGSAGSGVDQVSGPQSFSTEGPFTAMGTATDVADNISAATVVSGKIDNQDPTVTATCPSNIVIGSAATASWTAVDESDGSGIQGPSTGTVALDTSSVGNHTANIPVGVASDNVGHPSTEGTCTYNVIYNFAGFFQPVTMTGMNVVKAGSAVPIKFSLNGNYGLGILPAAPQFLANGTASSGATITDTVTAGSSSLSYDPTTDQYVYVWKTDKAWAGQSGTLTVTLNDGTKHTAQFSFTK